MSADMFKPWEVNCMLANQIKASCPQIKLSASGVAHDDFRKRMQALVMEVKARGEPKAEDQSIAALLLKLKDPKTGVAHCLLQTFAFHLASAELKHLQPLSPKH